MFKSMKILSAALGFAIICANHASALNVDVDIKTSTNHQDCKVFAEGVVNFVSLYIKSTNDGEKTWLIEQVNYMKKQLRKCEKRNRKVKTDVGVKIGGTYNFTEK